jgi:sec-independent protein translocase protein TatB
MLDIGWTELLVIAIVLIVVVGPKDLPPMLRAFGKMTKRLRTMAGEFRQQFDEALREADLDDVRKTLSDAQKLNPVNSLKDALNPLRQMGNDIRNDIQSATKADAPQIAEPWSPGEPAQKLPDTPPVFPEADPAPALDAKSAETPASRDAEPAPAKAARKPRTLKAVTANAEAAAPVIATVAAEKPKAKRAPKAQAPAETAITAVAVEAPASTPAPKKAAPRKTAAAVVEPPKASPAKQKKPAARTKKTGDA